VLEGSATDGGKTIDKRSDPHYAAGVTRIMLRVCPALCCSTVLHYECVIIKEEKKNIIFVLCNERIKMSAVFYPF